MHDPMVVAFEIRRPWPQRSSMPRYDDSVRWRFRHYHTHIQPWCDEEGCIGEGHAAFPWWKPGSYAAFSRIAGRDYYWPAMIIVWHVEPGGRDSLSICSRRYQDKQGNWHYTRGWRWHVNHWHFQFPSLQELRRRLLTRCAWCGGRSTKKDPVNVSHQWDGPRGRWWQGDPGLFHVDCSTVEHVHRMCLCLDPLPRNGDYGECLVCGKFRGWGSEPDEADRLLYSLPHGSRIPALMRPQLEVEWAKRRARKRREET